MVFDKFKQRLLNRSESYNFYKNEYESNNKKIEKLEQLVNTHQNFLNNIYMFYELTPNEYLARMRKLSYEFLKFMDNVCTKYDLDWWIDYGTLLGAVRHNDFVPWDDDLDTGMLRADYNKLIEVMPKEIEANNLDKVVAEYKLNRGELKTRRWFQIRYHYPGFRNTFVTIDVFPYDYVKDYHGEDIEDKFTELVKGYYQFTKDDDLTDYIKKINDEMNLTEEQTDYFIPSVENARGRVPRVNIYKFKVFKRDEIFPLKIHKFGEYEFPVPNQYRDYLEFTYGKNYLRLPRKIRDHKRLNTFNKEENIIEMLDEGIYKLEKANERYE